MVEQQDGGSFKLLIYNDEEGEKAKTKMPEDESSTARDGNIEISMVSSDLKLPEKKARNPNRSSVKKKPENSITFR